MILIHLVDTLAITIIIDNVGHFACYPDLFEIYGRSTYT